MAVASQHGCFAAALALVVLEVELAGVVHEHVVEVAWIVKVVCVELGLVAVGWRWASLGMCLPDASSLLQ